MEWTTDNLVMHSRYLKQHVWICGGVSFREERLTLAERGKMDVLKKNDDDDEMMMMMR